MYVRSVILNGNIREARPVAVYEVLLQKAAANHCVVTCFKHSLLPAQLRQFFAQKYFSS